MRVAAVTHVCIFLNGRQIQTADLNKFAECVFFEKSRMVPARFTPPFQASFNRVPSISAYFSKVSKRYERMTMTKRMMDYE